MRATSRRLPPIAGAALAACAAAACGGDGDDGGPTPTPPPQPVLSVEWVLPAAPDPFEGVDSWRVTLSSNGRIVVDESFAPGESPVLEDVLPQENVVIALEGCAGGCGAGTVLARGKTLPFAITGEEQTVSMWFARARTFNVPNGIYVPRALPSVGTFPDGRVLIAGGSLGDVPRSDTTLYDPWTDTLSTVAAMPSPHAGAAGVMVSTTAFLVAGGFGTGGFATDAAEIWIHDVATGTGSWRSAAPLAQSRAEMGWGSMGPGLAVLVAGSHAGGIRDSIEVFSWDGNVGSWTNAQPFANRVMGSIVISLDGAALIAGGFVRNVNNGNETFRDNIELLRFDGASWTRTLVGTLARQRAWSAVIPEGPDRWVLAGGLTDSMANPGPPGILTRSTDVLTWDGAAATSVTGTQLTGNARRGGVVVLGDGTRLLVGGDASRMFEYPDPLDRVLAMGSAGTHTIFTPSPGPTLTAYGAPMPDGTTLVITDAGVFRWNP